MIDASDSNGARSCHCLALKMADGEEKEGETKASKEETENTPTVVEQKTLAENTSTVVERKTSAEDTSTVVERKTLRAEDTSTVVGRKTLTVKCRNRAPGAGVGRSSLLPLKKVTQ